MHEGSDKETGQRVGSSPDVSAGVGHSRVQRVRYSASTSQLDDAAMMVLESGMPPSTFAEIELPALLENLPDAVAFINAEFSRAGCPSAALNRVDIALEELFVNVCHYAYPDATVHAPGTVRVSVACYADPAAAVVELADTGIPFDPLAKPDPTQAKSIEEAKIGGLGIMMAKQSVNEIHYRYEEGSNIVTFVKRW